MARTTNTVAGLRAGAWANVVLGIMIIAVPFFTVESMGAFWNNVIVGLLIVGFAGYNAYQASKGMMTTVWTAGLNVLLGIWLVLYPFFTVSSQGFRWADVILGLLVAVIAGYNAWAISQARTPTRARRVV